VVRSITLSFDWEESVATQIVFPMLGRTSDTLGSISFDVYKYAIPTGLALPSVVNFFGGLPHLFII
jgi:hypothetical protein